MLSAPSISELVARAEADGKPLSEVILELETAASERGRDEIWEGMRAALRTMREAAERGTRSSVRSMGGLVEGCGRRVNALRLRGESILGEPMTSVVAKALAVAEVNAAMGRVVACPTAGSCGVVPGVILGLGGEQASEDDLVRALFTAAGVGYVIAQRATVSGAEGGCQAECGAASAMAAAAAVEIAGGSPRQAADAVAIALKSFLGLVCDPVAGLVEVPCIKRNASAAAVALVAAEMALAGIESVIPADEVIDAMGEIGRRLPLELRETARGGLAATPTGRLIAARFRADE